MNIARRHRLIVGHELKKYQTGTDGSFGQDEKEGQDRAEPRGMPAAAYPERPDEQCQDGKKRQSTRQAV